MSSYYDIMQVCMRGHKITEYYNADSNNREDFCRKCGASTIHFCNKCKTNIRGHHHFDDFFSAEDTKVPLNCHSCGSPYPWRNRLFLENLGISLIAPLKYLVDTIAGIFKK